MSNSDQGSLLANSACQLSDLVDHPDFHLERIPTQVSLTKSTLLAEESKVRFVRTESLGGPHLDGPGVAFVWLHLSGQDNHVVLSLRVAKVTRLPPHTGAFCPCSFAGVHRRPRADEEAFSDHFNLSLLACCLYPVLGQDVRLS